VREALWIASDSTHPDYDSVRLAEHNFLTTVEPDAAGTRCLVAM
jgi:hypothetical protein